MVKEEKKSRTLWGGWWGGFISAILVAIFSLVATILWQGYTQREENKQTEKRIVAGLKEELANNLDRLKDNQELIKKELEALNEHEDLVSSLFCLQNEFWNLIKINLPKKLVEKDIRVRLRDIIFLTEKINDDIRSRENYRINNRAMTNYESRLKIYDDVILKNIEKINCTDRRIITVIVI